MSYRCFAAVCAVIAVVTLAAVPASAQMPRTPWGAPDLQGIWDFRTITPLERPEELGDKAFLTVEEAAAAEAAEVQRNIELWEAEGRGRNPEQHVAEEGEVLDAAGHAPEGVDALRVMADP